MAGVHRHRGGEDAAPESTPPTGTHGRLLTVLAPLLVAAVVGVVWFWPAERGDPAGPAPR